MKALVSPTGDERYNREDAEQLRETVIVWRNKAMEQWPESIPFTLEASHLIMFLSLAIDDIYGKKEDVPA